MKNEIVKLIEQALQDQKKDVDNSFPSIFSRDDVKLQLENFGYELITIVMEMKEEKSSRSISLEGVEELSNLLCGAIASKIERLDSSDVVDFDSVSLSISYNNQVEIDSIDYISDTITDEVESAVEQVLHDFFTPEEEEVQVQEPQQ